MNTQILNTKKLSKEINRAFARMERAKTGYVFSVISLGEKLLKARETVGFGGWDRFINDNSELSFGRIQASKYMQIARHKDLVISLFRDGDVRPSVNQLTKAISNATPEQVEAAKALPAVEKKEQVQSHGRSFPQPLPASMSYDEPIDAEFSEIKPEETESGAAPEQESSEPSRNDEVENLKDMVHELQSQIDELTADNDQMHIVFDDDNHTTAAIREISKLKESNRILNERITGLMNEKNEAIRSAKYFKNKAERLEKKMKELDNV